MRLADRRITAHGSDGSALLRSWRIVGVLVWVIFRSAFGISSCRLTRLGNRRTASLSLIVVTFLGLTACTTRTESMNQSELTDLATRYAAAWSSQNPEELASFHAEDGSLTVNAGDPAVGRAAIAAKARGFMDAFVRCRWSDRGIEGALRRGRVRTPDERRQRGQLTKSYLTL